MKKNSLAEKNPELAKEWHPTLNGDLTPWDVTRGSGKKVWWLCEKGHQWEVSVGNRDNSQSRCPYCSNQKTLGGYNDLATTLPELSMEWHPTLNGDLKPWNVTCGSNRKIWWQCRNNNEHEWKAVIKGRAKGIGCPFCYDRHNPKKGMDLVTANKGISMEWHPTKNGTAGPQDVSVNSNAKVWWQCSKYKEHFWHASPNARRMGNGCPICANKKILQGYNDLGTCNPLLAKEWHPTKNNELTPDNVFSGSTKSVWWVCSEKHEWKASLWNRKKGSGCPFCSGRPPLTEMNSLAMTNPELSKEWHPNRNGDLTPHDVRPFSNRKVWWICRKGHEWKAHIENRSKGSGCKKCNTEMQTSFPEQAIYYYLKQVVPAENRASVFGKEVDIYIPSWGIGIEYDGMYFHNSDTSLERERKKNIVLSENGIQLIRVKETIESMENSSNIIYCTPDTQYHYLKPMLVELVGLLSEIKGYPIPQDINIERDRIEIMEQYIEREKHNSLALKNPLLATEWHLVKNGRIKPEHVSFGSGKKVWWQCAQGHEWQAAVSSRNNGHARCPECNKAKQRRNRTSIKNDEPTAL